MDGWEEDDNPVTEHLKHAPDCGWAIMMDLQQSSSNPASIEDPTGDRITQARLSTFGTAWPHDEKKGWVCQSEKVTSDLAVFILFLLTRTIDGRRRMVFLPYRRE